MAGSCALVVGNSYCVEQNFGHPIETTPTTTGAHTSTVIGNDGITTPSPTQPGIAPNCDKFHLVQSGDTCSSIASRYGITLQDFYNWNKGVGSQCESLWLGTYCCVHVLSFLRHPSTPTVENVNTHRCSMQMNEIRLTELCSRSQRLHRPSQEWSVAALNSTKASNPQWLIAHIVEPQVSDSSIVVTGDICSSICAKYGISLSDFYSWNPGVGSECQGLWLNTYCCVGRG